MSSAKRTATLGALLAALLAWSFLEREPLAGPAAAGPAREPRAAALPASDRAAELDEPRSPLRTLVAPSPIEAPGSPIEAPAPAAEAEQQTVALPRAEAGASALEVLVQQAGLPLVGARVLVHGRRSGGPPQELERLLEHGLEGVTGADGVMAFGVVEPDTYTLRVLAAHLPVLEITAVKPSDRGARVLAFYGTAAVEGRVHDELGAPLADCWILARSQSAPSDGPWSHLWTATGADGAFRVDGLPAGIAWITRTCGADESVSIVLESGRPSRVDFGWPGGAPIWRGTVRGTDGAAFDVPGHLTTLRLENGERGQFAYAEDGGFAARLRPGRYAISALGYEGSSVVGEVEIPPQGLAQDVTLPLARVVVDLDYIGGRSDQRGLLDALVVRLRRPGSAGRAAENVSGGLRVFRGVPPGDYDLVVGSLPMDALAESESLPLTVPPETAVVRTRIAIP